MKIVESLYKVYNKNGRLIFITEDEKDLKVVLKQRKLKDILIYEVKIEMINEWWKIRDDIISDEFLGFLMTNNEFNMIRKNIPNEFIYSEAIVDVFKNILLDKGINYKFGVVKEMYDLAKVIYDNNKDDIKDDIEEILISVNDNESIYFKMKELYTMS